MLVYSSRGGSGRVDAVSSPLCTRLARCGGSGCADASSGLETTLSSPLSLGTSSRQFGGVGVAVVVVQVPVESSKHLLVVDQKERCIKKHT